MFRSVGIAMLALNSAMLAQTFEEYPHTITPPYAGRYEARIGSASEPSHEKLRLDIGASIDILTIRDSTRVGGTLPLERNRLSIGADFFTWSRLRSQDNFKFPVEAVDYYFGINAGLRLARVAGRAPLISEVRLRVAHVSAHLVDGDPAFADSTAGDASTYSREFVDAMIAVSGERMARVLGVKEGSLRPYLGIVWIFHDIPSIHERATPYAGLDAHIVPITGLPFVVKAGYEGRLNTEIAPSVGEHHARLGVKIGKPQSNGVTLEASYYSGRSLYGQYFGRSESYLSLGFAVEY